LNESGIDVEADAWMGLIGPAGLPTEATVRIGRLVGEAVTSPAIREKLASQLMEPIPDTPAEFRARIDADVVRWKPVIEAAHIRID
jgi:tripartite-type tricarboxylate transporter receptor subunit TctC